MPKWKKDQTTFRIRLHYDGRRGCMTTLPKPVLDFFKNPEFLVIKIMKSGKVNIVNGDDV